MGFIKYIFELIVVLYIVRMVMRFIDATFSVKPIQPKQNSGTVQDQFTKTTESTKPKPSADDYIDFEEIKETK